MARDKPPPLPAKLRESRYQTPRPGEQFRTAFQFALGLDEGGPLGRHGATEEEEKFFGDHFRIVEGNKVARVDYEDFRLRNQGGGSLGEFFRHGFVMGAMENECGNPKLRQHLRDGRKEFGRIAEPYYGHQAPRTQQTGKGSAKISHRLSGLGPPCLQGETHGDVPENSAHDRGEEFADNRNTDQAEKVKRLQLWKHGGRQKDEMVHVFLKAVRVMHGDGGTGIVPDDMPFLDVAFDADLLNLLGEELQLLRTVGDLR